MSSRRRPRHDNNTRRNHHNSSNNNNNNNVDSNLIGTTVKVVQKQDQPTGRLTSGIVADILTNATFHPRGIKVRLQDGTVGRIHDGSGGGGGSGGPHAVNEHFTATNYDDDFPAPRTSHSLADFMPSVAQSQPQPQPQSQPQLGSTDELLAVWSCPACTFENSGLLMECELCQTSKTMANKTP